jgi:hypothetical protein
VLPVRFLCPPEIVLITLRPGPEAEPGLPDAAGGVEG